MTTERLRSIRAVFPDAALGLATVDRLREAGFRVEVSGSMTGEVDLNVQVASDRLGELEALVRDNGGRIEPAESANTSPCRRR